MLFLHRLQNYLELLLIRITGLEKAQMHQEAAKTIYIIELAAAKPPPTLRYTYFLMLLGAFGLVFSTVSLINSNSKVHVIFTWRDVKITWLLELLLFRITVHLAFGV